METQRKGESLEAMLLRAEKMGMVAIDSAAEGMVYITDPKDRRRVMIATGRGRVLITTEQAAALSAEIESVVALYCKK